MSFDPPRFYYHSTPALVLVLVLSFAIALTLTLVLLYSCLCSCLPLAVFYSHSTPALVQLRKALAVPQCFLQHAPGRLVAGAARRRRGVALIKHIRSSSGGCLM